MGEHAKVRIHDPKALENARIDLKEMQGDVSFEEDVYKALEGAHVLALVTQWAEYRELDFERIYNKMVKPAFVFDGRNHLEHEKLFDIGFNHQRRKCERCSLRTISYFGSIWELYDLDLKTKGFCGKENQLHGQGTHSAKIVVIVWPQKPHMPFKLSAQFVCPSPKALKF